MHDFKKLTVWKQAIDLTVEVYSVTREFPSSEKFNLISQINRSAVSIASNIGEGAGRQTKGEFVQFLGYSGGSCTELETQLILAFRLGFISEEKFQLLSAQTHSIQKMLYNLIKSINK